MRYAILITALTVLATGQASLAAPKEVKLPDIKPTARVYKTVGDVKLQMHIFNPPDHKASDHRPAIVFFFGGGWTGGKPEQFFPHCQYLASRGMVAMSAEYRVKSRHNVTPVKCVTDAKSAIRWARQHAEELGIDPNQIVAGGGSAGGHLAACTGVVPGFNEEGEDASISTVPSAMILFNPALDISEHGFPGRGNSLVARFDGKQRELSPIEHVAAKQPPTIIFHGKADKTVPFDQAVNFTKAMKDAGNTCTVVGAEGQDHGYFNYGRGDGRAFVETLRAADEFLQSLKMLEGKATIE